MEKSYLWIGCNKKYVHLKASQKRRVRFKLAFVANGVFEIGGALASSSEHTLKMSLLEATGGVATSASQPRVYSANDLNSIGSSSSESSGISVFLKKKSPAPTASNRYELFKRISPFSVCVNR